MTGSQYPLFLNAQLHHGFSVSGLTKINAKDKDATFRDHIAAATASLAGAVTGSEKIAVVGLGYVGLPLAVALAGRFPVVGYDISQSRVDELKSGHDRTGEIDGARLRVAAFTLTANSADLSSCNIFIITVPTPVGADNRPDLTAVISACRTVGAILPKGSVVVLESTVYPGVTEDICGPEIEEVSGLRCGYDFFLGYSPERINPGDKTHTVDKITKVVSGQTDAVAQRLAAVYGAITSGGVFIARGIKVAEAAKVIENAQRDINIAFVNEVTMIFNSLGLSVYDVLAASATKWNFLRFTPGLVGGHCIGVDPFYLADVAQRLGHDPAVILAGRRINDGMGAYIAGQIAATMGAKVRKAKILVLGLTFKENVPDLRNSKVVDVIEGLARDYVVHVHDPLADTEEAKAEYGIDLMRSLETASNYDCVVGAVAHHVYAEFTAADLSRMLAPNGLLADIKGMWREVELPAGMRRWQL